MTAFGMRASLGFGLAAAMVMAAGPSAAAGGALAAKDRAAVLQALSDCRKQADGTARLACFDRAAAQLDEAEARGDIVVADKEQVRQVRRQAFGFTLPSLSVFDRPGQRPEEADALTARVESAAQGGDGKWVIRLEGGQVWRQVDTEIMTHEPRAGGMVTIRRASLGSYRLNAGGAGAMRVRRDN